MATDPMIPINVVIADRSYRLRIRPEEEHWVRSRIKEVNDKIVEFKTAYAGKDLQDYIAMCLIWYASQPPSSGTDPGHPDIEQRLQDLEKLLDDALKSTR